MLSIHHITPHHTTLNHLTGDWKTACAHFKSMLATERFVVEIDDVAREQVRQDKSRAHETSLLFLLVPFKVVIKCP